MIKSIRLLFLGLVCATVAGCTSTTPDNSDLAVTPLVPMATSMAAPAAMGMGNLSGAPQTGEVAQDLYYLEFRSRTADSYGHTFAMFGRRDAQGRILTREVAGLHPATTSTVPYMMGHVVPVPAETGPSDGDLEDAYMTANYRIDLTRAQYEYVVAYIRELQNSRPLWHAVIYNCNSFVGDIAKHIGLRAPNNMLFPPNYITTLREMNNGRNPFTSS